MVAEESDYSHSLLYACTNSVIKEEYIYMFSRKTNLDVDQLNIWMTSLSEKGVDVSGVKKISQEGCW